MSTVESSLACLKNLFLAGVEAATPKSLFHHELGGREDVQRSLAHDGKRYHVVGFGKAVLGMAVQIEKLLGSRLKSGLISIPVGTRERFAGVSDFSLSPASVIEVIECANNNLPDEQATIAASRIKALAMKMTPDDVLCVLVSGGGSALLCLPKQPVTLAEKLKIIKALANSGATINELNYVRIALSGVKGGQLAMAAKEAFRVHTYVISDIVGDPVGLIASGPTVATGETDTNKKAKLILEKYHLWDDLPKSVLQVLEAPTTPDRIIIQGSLFVLGSNKVAVQRILDIGRTQDLSCFVLSTTIQGNVSNVSELYVSLAETLYKFKTDVISEHKLRENIERLFDEFRVNIANEELNAAEFVANIANSKNQNILIVGAGEPTVCVQGGGKGGRNQELAMRVSLRLERTLAGDRGSVCFLSAGTDGIDGPTDVAGAVGGVFVARAYEQLANVEDAASLLKHNDSYRFYSSIENGQYFIKTGHTGTNVMDLHLLLIKVR